MLLKKLDTPQFYVIKLAQTVVKKQQSLEAIVKN